MYSYKIKFIALGDTIAFEINSPDLNVVQVFVNDLLSIFIVITEDDKPTIIALQELSTEINAELTRFIEKYKSRLPQLNAVAAFFKKLEENEKFFFLPNIEMELAESIKLRDSLRAIKEGKTYEELTDKTEDLFGDLMTKYNIGVKGEQRIHIGEKLKNKRVCRFCHKSQPDTTFNNKAHAISEALGNKTIILLEECDECNSRFSKTIEPNIISYLSLFRTFFDIKAKGGSKKFKGKNFTIKYDKNPSIELTEGNAPDIGEDHYNIKLEANDPIVLQNIYKTLCKYYLSIIDKEELSNFSETIKWINGEIESETLPKIAEMISYHSFSTQPKLTHYIRKIDDKTLPFAVGEFYFTCKLFVFIIPFSSQDDRDFRDDTDYKHFWTTFKHFDKSKGWEFRDYSNKNPREFSINLNFQKEKKNKAST